MYTFVLLCIYMYVYIYLYIYIYIYIYIYKHAWKYCTRARTCREGQSLCSVEAYLEMLHGKLQSYIITTCACVRTHIQAQSFHSLKAYSSMNVLQRRYFMASRTKCTCVCAGVHALAYYYQNALKCSCHNFFFWWLSSIVWSEFIWSAHMKHRKITFTFRVHMYASYIHAYARVWSQDMPHG